jgi:hypothetical protein
VDRDPDRPGVIRDRPRDRLSDPPGRIRRELESPAVLEPVDRLHEADVPFLDEVQERHVVVQVPLGNRDDEAKVCLHQGLLGQAHLELAGVQVSHDPDRALGRQPQLRFKPSGALATLALQHLVRGPLDLLLEPGQFGGQHAEAPDPAVDDHRLERKITEQPHPVLVVLGGPLLERLDRGVFPGAVPGRLEVP